MQGVVAVASGHNFETHCSGAEGVTWALSVQWALVSRRLWLSLGQGLSLTAVQSDSGV